MGESPGDWKNIGMWSECKKKAGAQCATVHESPNVRQYSYKPGYSGER